MPKSKSRKKKQPKRVLALPDLGRAKAAVRASTIGPARHILRKDQLTPSLGVLYDHSEYLAEIRLGAT